MKRSTKVAGEGPSDIRLSGGNCRALGPTAVPSEPQWVALVAE